MEGLNAEWEPEASPADTKNGPTLTSRAVLALG